MLKIGIDIGSTTLKYVVIDKDNEILYSSYERHYSLIKEKLVEVLTLIKNKFNKSMFSVSISGSGGMGIANSCDLEFVQEVYATKNAVSNLTTNTNVVIELGGEDAKIIFLNNSLEVRMNGTCAGGTGAFIDQMASLLDISVSELNELAKNYKVVYPIASRCGVFAKTDIQPLLNQGAKKEDVSYSILNSVVNQTIGGLAQGRKIEGSIIYLGGPLTFISQLRSAFDSTLGVKGILPDNSLLFVAIGTALASNKIVDINEILYKLKSLKKESSQQLKPLFKDKNDYLLFKNRHDQNSVNILGLDGFDENLYLGIDSGSTTLKMVLIDGDKNIRYQYYTKNKGNPVQLLLNELSQLYSNYPLLKIKSSASTGYGEDLIKAAFNLDSSLVETMAHYKAAKHFLPNVDFIIDIGGQDIKCFKIDNGIITNIFLNEACSSGCGSFIQSFSESLNFDVSKFTDLVLDSTNPVELGSRCTVFMNSSVKQAQKDGSSLSDILAGLSISVVKNALYKVIRISNPNDLGKNIVVQGGTFLNDSVIRAFEMETNRNVIRPSISGLMGAYGAAIHSMSIANNHSSILTKEELANFVNKTSTARCGLCQNNCLLNINSFNKNKFISGNNCEKPIKKNINSDLNIYQYIRNLLNNYSPIPGKRGKIGIPLVLNNYELLPFWHSFFTKLNFEVYSSKESNKYTYSKGQLSIPSDTICYPAKLVHGHIESLIEENINIIFYPSMTYNINENISDNHYNCPVVAYYPETIKNNLDSLIKTTFINDFININNQKYFINKIHKILGRYFKDISKKEIKQASQVAYEELKEFKTKISNENKRIIETARKENKPIILLAGRPYHIDSQVSHGIDKLISSFDTAVINESSFIDNLKPDTNILNQWTYHARMYKAAESIKNSSDINLIQ
ncbi:MAG: acyl-CoA dehydratase activase, partial [Anaeroplasmataceae bacterium]